MHHLTLLVFVVLSFASLAQAQSPILDVVPRAGTPAEVLPTPTLDSVLRPEGDTDSSRSFFESEQRSGDFTFDLPVDRIHREAFLDGVSNSCRLQILERLGWVLQAEAGREKFKLPLGNPCDNSSLAEARAAGELTLLMPEDRGASLDTDEVARVLSQALLSETSICAYKFPVARAAQVAAARLSANKNFGFYGGSPMVRFYGNDIPWVGSCVSSRGTQQCFFGKYTASRAIQHFTHGKVETECALGLQVAEYETLHQLFGEGFDRHFDRDEIFIAPWSLMHNGTSATWGRGQYSQTQDDRYAVKSSEMGARWFEGVSGYIGNIFGERYLDSPVDRGENFLTVEVSADAAAQLHEMGGFAALNKRARQVWELSRGLSDRAKVLAGNNENLDNYEMSSQTRRRIEDMRALLREPVFAGYKVFVHPLSVMSFGEHILRLTRVNPRTPYQIRLYPSRMQGGLYRRYLQSLANQCDS